VTQSQRNGTQPNKPTELTVHQQSMRLRHGGRLKPTLKYYMCNRLPTTTTVLNIYIFTILAEIEFRLSFFMGAKFGIWYRGRYLVLRESNRRLEKSAK